MNKGDIMNKKTVIFDLDGTLANIDVRRDKSTKPNGKLDWDIFASPTSIMDWMHLMLPSSSWLRCLRLMVSRLLSLVVETIEVSSLLKIG